MQARDNGPVSEGAKGGQNYRKQSEESGANPEEA